MTRLIAKFDSPEPLVEAVKRLQGSGFHAIDAFSPYPHRKIENLLGGKTSAVAWIAALSALAGGLITYGVIYWTAVIDYPLNIGGRPLNSWPAFLPPVLIAAALWSGLATLLSMLLLAGLPRWHDPLFDVRQFDRATYDRFFLVVEAENDDHERQVRAVLDAARPEAVEYLP